MAEFKIGDHVRVIGLPPSPMQGTIFNIERYHRPKVVGRKLERYLTSVYHVQLTNGKSDAFYGEYLELVYEVIDG